MARAEPLTNTILYLDGVSVSFDGFRAINNLSLTLDKGEMRAIIGPNGAGKTTMMDLITGKTRPDKGEIYFDGAHDLTRYDEAEIANLGIGRKFQKPTVFECHTVEDNIALSLKGPRGAFRTIFDRRSASEPSRIDEILAIIRLTDRRDELAANLSHGQKQWLEIGMVLIQKPTLILLDEPVAGMTSGERRATGELLREIAREHAILVVEHDMNFVRAFSTKVSVLHMGELIKEGSMEEVQRDPRVIASYLGRSGAGRTGRARRPPVRAAGPLSQWERADA